MNWQVAIVYLFQIILHGCRTKPIPQVGLATTICRIKLVHFRFVWNKYRKEFLLYKCFSKEF